MIISGYIHLPENGITNPSLWLKSLLYVRRVFFIHSACWIPRIVPQPCSNKHRCASILWDTDLEFLGWIPRGGTAGLFRRSILSSSQPALAHYSLEVSVSSIKSANSEGPYLQFSITASLRGLALCPMYIIPSVINAKWNKAKLFITTIQTLY